MSLAVLITRLGCVLWIGSAIDLGWTPTVADLTVLWRLHEWTYGWMPFTSDRLAEAVDPHMEAVSGLEFGDDIRSDGRYPLFVCLIWFDGEKPVWTCGGRTSWNSFGQHLLKPREAVQIVLQ